MSNTAVATSHSLSGVPHLRIFQSVAVPTRTPTNYIPTTIYPAPTKWPNAHERAPSRSAPSWAMLQDDAQGSFRIGSLGYRDSIRRPLAPYRAPVTHSSATLPAIFRF